MTERQTAVVLCAFFACAGGCFVACQWHDVAKARVEAERDVRIARERALAEAGRDVQIAKDALAAKDAKPQEEEPKQRLFLIPIPAPGSDDGWFSHPDSNTFPRRAKPEKLSL